MFFTFALRLQKYESLNENRDCHSCSRDSSHDRLSFMPEIQICLHLSHYTKCTMQDKYAKQDPKSLNQTWGQNGSYSVNSQWSLPCKAVTQNPKADSKIHVQEVLSSLQQKASCPVERHVCHAVVVEKENVMEIQWKGKSKCTSLVSESCILH